MGLHIRDSMWDWRRDRADCDINFRLHDLELHQKAKGICRQMDHVSRTTKVASVFGARGHKPVLDPIASSAAKHSY